MAKKTIKKAAKPVKKAAKPVKKAAAKPVKKVVKKVAKPVKKAAAPVKKAVKPVKAKVIAKPVKKPVAKKTVPVIKVKTIVKAKAPVKAKKPVTPKKVTPVVVKKPVAKALPVKKTPTPVVKKVEKIVKPVEVKKEEKKSIPFFQKKIIKEAPMKDDHSNIVRYSDKELMEFRQIIINKLETARKDMVLLNEAFTNSGGNATDDTSPIFKVLEEGSQVLSKEENSQLAARLKKFIQNLEAALVRIENKSYGICRVTGKLIPKERLRSVPHATLSIEAKLNQKPL